MTDIQVPGSDHNWLLHTIQPVPAFADLLHSLQLVSVDRFISSFREDLVQKSTVQANFFSRVLATRFLITFDISDFGEALELQCSILKARQDDTSVMLRASNAVNAAESSLLDTSVTVDADNVQSLKEAVQESSIMDEFRSATDIAKIHECVSLYRKYIMQDTNGTSTAQAQLAQNNLAYSLLVAYIATGQVSHLEEGIVLYRGLITEISSSYRFFPLLSLAGALVVHSTHISDNSSLLEEAATHLDQFSAAFGDRNTLLQRAKLCFDGSYDPRKIDEAISLYSQATAFHPIRHQGRPALLNDLAMALSTRYHDNHQVDYLEQVATLYKDATKCHSHNRGAQFVRTSRELAKSLLRLYDVTHTQRQLNEAMDAFREAMTTVSSEESTTLSTTRNLNIAKEWAQSAHTHHHPSAMEAYRYAIKLVPAFTLGGKGNFSTRLFRIAMAANELACSAAGCAIEVGNYEEAVEILEARSVLWTQAMQLQTPLVDLLAISPDLAERLQNTIKILEESSLLKFMATDAAIGPPAKDQDTYLQKINAQQEEILTEIRRLEGFHDFLLPKTFSSLIRAANNGPVVILTAAVETSGCDALILTPDGCFRLPLTTIAQIEVRGLVRMLRSGVSSNSSRYASRDINGPDSETDIAQGEGVVREYRLEGKRVQKVLPTSQKTFRTVLATLWTHVVSPVLEHLKLEKTSSPSRIWWYTTGEFTSLPIHASGIYYPEDGDLACASDYVVSSYTPNLSTLLPSNRKASQRGAFKMMAVIQADVPGQPHLNLYYTREELNKIKIHIPSANLLAFGTPDNPSSIDKVLAHIDECSIVHFACHGSQSVDNPLESSLLLADGNLKISQIINRSLSNASLAFLSACETAMGDKELPDEFIHIATTMLFAGFPSVVATMWSIRDDDGPVIADEFYRNMIPKATVNTTDKPIVEKETFFDKILHRFCIPKHISDKGTWKKPESSGAAPIVPDTAQAAVALHLATAKLRGQKDCSFKRWVPFIHIGL